MLKNPEYSQAFDSYDNEQVETHVIEPITEGFVNQEYEEIEDYDDAEESLDGETLDNEQVTLKKRKPEKEIDITNHDLRLINAYFQEVSTEPLLTPQEESLVAAKIKSCETKAKDIKKVLENALGCRLEEDPESLESQVNAILELDERSSKKIKELQDIKAKARLRMLMHVYKATIKKGVQLRNRFVKSNLRLVASMAKRYAGRGIPFLDLIQEGNLGLIKAVERFDYSKGFRFSTYACWWINQAMTRGVFNQTRTVKMPAYLLEKAGKVRHVKRVLTEQNKREPIPEEIAEKAQMSVENVKRILESSGNRVVRLDTPVYDGEKATYLDYVEDSSSLVVDSIIAEISIPGNIDTALLRLTERERDVVKMRFGIGYESAYTLDEIGKKFKLTRERIRQIEKKALERIKRSKSAPVLRSLMDVYNH
ncbi:MAG: sigma-70 family RNA polymerase sigma factor [Thermodesulfobacteriales bacterium]|nr:MAG: sigma-70 family RNA polymerase sigma factor [Thermodesulfobacteriales bacterium]